MIYILLFIIFIVADQLTKFLASKFLIVRDISITSWFKFSYVENRGAAFGMMQDKQSFFIVITALVLVVIGFYILKHGSEFSTLEKIELTFFLSGAVGNLIDRILNGYVVDFISVRLFNSYDFPVFNIADSLICVGAFLLIISFIKGDFSEVKN